MPVLQIISKSVKDGVGQYSVLLNPKTCHTGDYIHIYAGEKSLISKIEYSDDVPINKVYINRRLHTQTLSINLIQDCECSFVSDVEDATEIVVKLNKSNRIVRNPRFNDKIYLDRGYVIKCNDGYGVVTSGHGLYDHVNALSTEDIISDLCVNSVPISVNIDFSKMGIGGLHKQMNKLIRQVLISRIIDDDMRRKYMVKDIKGILLHGPPGTGKTLIAKNIAKIIPDSVIQKINGPELSSKFYGETESNIRRIFDSAKDHPTELHVIIFDEIDSIGRKRGGSSSQFDDKVLTQLLTMIDGLESANNILVIGITNRKDVLDPALTRAGRLECHIEIPLPTEGGREEILDIYLNPLRELNLISDIDTKLIANMTDGWSGADIESMIGRAKNLALLRNCDIDEASIRQKENQDLSVITMDDVVTAMNDYQPTKNQSIDIYVQNWPDTDRDMLENLLSNANRALSSKLNTPYVIDTLTTSQDDRILAAHLASELDLPYIQHVSYNDMIGKSTYISCSILEEAYINCLQAERSVLLIDGLDYLRDRGVDLRVRYIIEQPLCKDVKLVIIILSGNAYN